MPSNTGDRQPIHAIQLAEVVYFIMKKFLISKRKPNINCINIGGDQTLDFGQMINTLKDSLKVNDRAKRCVIIKIPNRLFFILISPIMILSPKYFASLARICSNLSGFDKACDITKTEPKSFPCRDI